ncbi:MAG: agmatinase [Crenarchaeota archaeon]|nr:agmatinase [Thermoproteota archaeon]
MSLAEVYLNPAPYCFGGSCVEPGKADFLVLGVPFDATSSYRPGSREAPLAVRVAAANIEFYSMISGVDLEEYRIGDLGDLAQLGDARDMVTVLRDIIASLPPKPLVVIGGEHTVTLGVYEGLVARGLNPCILVFDAHLDLRDEYMGLKLSHATFMRRLLERHGHDRVFYVATRAVCREEIEYARRHRVRYVTPQNIRLLGTMEVSRRIQQWLNSCGCDSLYISVDMDAYDPAYAPGVGNPEPGGLESWLLLGMLSSIVRSSQKRVVGIDVTEVSPPHDVGGITSVLAAKTVVEFLAAVATRRGGS